MQLLLYLKDKLVDTEPLHLTHLTDHKERDVYIQGAMNLLLEKWRHVLEEADAEPRFVLKLDSGERL